MAQRVDQGRLRPLMHVAVPDVGAFMTLFVPSRVTTSQRAGPVRAQIEEGPPPT